jgi:predicted enzyme related to lactoylglutathione lyase
MEHTIVHFEIPADQPERAAQFYRELFGWDIKQFEGSVAEEWITGSCGRCLPMQRAVLRSPA